MEKQLIINPDKTFTKTEYHKTYNVSRPKIDELIKNKELKTIKVQGTTLIIAK